MGGMRSELGPILDEPSLDFGDSVKCFICKTLIPLDTIHTHSRKCSRKTVTPEWFAFKDEEKKLREEWNQKEQSILAAQVRLQEDKEDLVKKLELLQQENLILSEKLSLLKKNNRKLTDSVDLGNEQAKKDEKTLKECAEYNMMLEKKLEMMEELTKELYSLRATQESQSTEHIEQEKAAIVLQSYIRRHNTQHEYHGMKHRHNIVKEIVSTEESYIHSLEILLKVWMHPLVAESQKPNGFINPDEIETIFSSVEEIYASNRILSSVLAQQLWYWNKDACIGNIFIDRLASFTSYIDYVTNYSTSISALKEYAAEREEFAEFLKQRLSLPEVHYSVFEDFLILPVQRIPRYILLLEALNRKTSAGHPDKLNLHEAIIKLKNFAEEINEQKRKKEQVLDIASRIGMEQIGLKSGRVLVKEGVFEDAERKFRYGFLFNDLVLYSKEAKASGKNWDVERSKWKKLEWIPSVTTTRSSEL